MTKSRIAIAALAIATIGAGFGGTRLLAGTSAEDVPAAAPGPETTTRPETTIPLEGDRASFAPDSLPEKSLPNADDDPEEDSGPPAEASEGPADPEPEGPLPAEPQPAEPQPEEPQPKEPMPEEPEPEEPKPEKPVHEVVVGNLEADLEPTPTHSIGEIVPGGLVPEGLDITAFPGGPEEPPVFTQGGGMVISPGPECAYQCIASGTAYPRGFGALLVVETKVPADIFISVLADTNDDGEDDFKAFEWSPGKVTEFSWPLDHLEPGQRYYAMAAATDENGDTSYAVGEFTTLSTRTVQIRVNSMEIHRGPDNVTQTKTLIRAAGEGYPAEINLNTGEINAAWYELGSWQQYLQVERKIDVDLKVIRRWDRKQPCEAGYHTAMETHHGKDGSACLAWTTATVDLDLDQIPSGPATWRSVSFAATLRNNAAIDDDALPNPLPPFDVAAPMTVNVVYGD